MKALRRVISFVRPYRWVAFFLVITVILPVLMELVVPRALRTVIDDGIVPGNWDVIVSGAGLMLAAAVAGALATLGQGYCRAHLSQGLAYDMRNALFAHIQSFSFANLDHMQTGELMTRLSSDVDLVRMFSSTGLALLLRAVLMVTGSVIMMFIIDWRLALIMLLLLPASALVISGIIRLAEPRFVKVQQKLSALNTAVQENLAGFKVVKAFVREPYETDRFWQRNSDYMEENIRVGRLMAFAYPLLTIISSVGIVSVVWNGGHSVFAGRLTVGELVAFNNYLLIGMAPLVLLGNILTMMSRAEASAARVWQVMDTKPVLAVETAAPTAVPLRGGVDFESVSFRYGGAGQSANGQVMEPGPEGRRVLVDVSFSAKPGQTVALLGATGSGKSTLVNLIPRFYDPSAGRVLIDGIDARQWQPDRLRAQIGMVLQQTLLFSGTIRENISYGRPEATQAEIEAAAKAAQAHQFISALPVGYDSPVEERGVNFSGGQKQRIAIARALLISPPILIMDDSTSAVDMQTEAAIQQALEVLMAGRTTFIVAQRISTAVAADQIIVLDNGRVAACGTHAALLSSSPIYQEIYHSQMGSGQENKMLEELL